MTTETRRLSLTETAKLLRNALATAFEGTKFSVRTRRYAGGSSIDVRWTDGPRPHVVNAIAQSYRGADFDGMTDCNNYRDAQELDGELVTMGCDFVSCQRTESDFNGLHARALAIIRERCKVEGAPGAEQFGNDWIDNLASGMARDADFRDAFPLEGSFLRRVIRRGD